MLRGRHLCGRPLSLREAGDPGLRRSARDLAVGFPAAGRPAAGRLQRSVCNIGNIGSAGRLPARRPDPETPVDAAAARPVAPIDRGEPMRPDLSVVVLCYRSGDAARSYAARLGKVLLDAGIDNYQLVLVGNYVA